MRIGQFTGAAVGILVLVGALLAAPPGRWTNAAPMPEERTEVAVAAVDGRFYVVRGYTQSWDPVASTLVYDPGPDQWRELAPMPTARGAPAGTFNQAEAYAPATDAWSTWAPMPTARHGLGAAAVGERIFVISGGPRPGGSYSRANEVFTP